LADYFEDRFVADGAYYPEAVLAYILVVYLISADQFSEK